MNEQPMRIDDLASILRREFENADSYHDVLLPLQEQAFRYYEAQPFGNEVDGRSQIVLPDVQETIDYMIASVLRTFVSGERTVEIEDDSGGRNEALRVANEVIDHNFMREQDGYRILHDVIHDGLLRKIGIFKTCVEVEERVRKDVVTLDPIQLGELDDNVEIEEYAENEDGTVTASIKYVTRERVFRDYAIPTTEFRFQGSARHEDDADYLAHVSLKTKSELIEMGFDREQVEDLPVTDSLPLDGRYYGSAHSKNYYDSDRDSSGLPIELQTVLLHEEYARVDLDGDGIAERIKVFRVENEILIDAETGDQSIEVVEDQPFTVFCPFPRPHRLVGYSLADKVLDIQLARSFVARQLFDGLAFSNMPRPVIDEDLATENTYKDVLSPIPGSPIRARGGPRAVQPFYTGFDPGKSLNVLEWITGERESRTGITRLNQGLDADALNKTATGTALMQAAGQQQEEFIARNFANAVGRLFLKKYRLMRNDGTLLRAMIDGEQVEIDPSTWPEKVYVRIKVGLGTGNKDRRVQARMAMLGPLTQALQEGLAGPEHAFRWFDGMARDTDIGTGKDFMYPPDSEAIQRLSQDDGQDIDPELQKVMGQLELERAKAQEKLRLEREKMEADIETIRQKHLLEMEVGREKAQLQNELEREKAAVEIDLAREKAEAEIALKMNLKDQNIGGDLDT